MVQEGGDPLTSRKHLLGLSKSTGIAAEALRQGSHLRPMTRVRSEAVAKAAGIGRDALQDPLLGKLGNTGTRLHTDCCSSRPSRSASPGTEAPSPQATETAPIAPCLRDPPAELESLAPRRGIAGHLARGRALGSYDAYLRSRKLDPEGVGTAGADLGALSPRSATANGDADIAFIGGRCSECGLIHLAAAAGPAHACKAKDQWEPARLSGQDRSRAGLQPSTTSSPPPSRRRSW